jgi:hypothetical protein
MSSSDDTAPLEQAPRLLRMWLYPLPALVALLGWIFVFVTTQVRGARLAGRAPRPPRAPRP